MEVGSPPPQNPGPPPENSTPWYLSPNTLVCTIPPIQDETVDAVHQESSSACSGSNESDVLIHSEENLITIGSDTSYVTTRTQTESPSCKCLELMTKVAELSVCVKALNSKVESNFVTLNNRLSLVLDTIVSFKENQLVSCPQYLAFLTHDILTPFFSTPDSKGTPTHYSKSVFPSTSTPTPASKGTPTHYTNSVCPSTPIPTGISA